MLMEFNTKTFSWVKAFVQYMMDVTLVSIETKLHDSSQFNILYISIIQI